jgi:hypothetical protein
MIDNKKVIKRVGPEKLTAEDHCGLPPRNLSRAELAWAVIAFQLKLMADGMRDVLLSPLSIGAALLGIIEGGEAPGRYFRRVIVFGRRTERWINLFGHHERDTADELLRPLEQRFHEELGTQKSDSADSQQKEQP